MKKVVCCTSLVLVFMFFVLPAAISAQEESDAITMEETVVTASRLEEPLKYSPDSVTVITEKEIREKGRQAVIDVLRDVPGVSVSQTGSFGGSASIYLRGTQNAHTLIMIDGVRVGDSMAIDSKLSITDLSTDNIERIEIVRGAQSVLYGSDAIGGVINIITKKGKGKPEWYLSFEGGSFETFRETIGLSGSSDKVSYSASVMRLDTRGVSKADEDWGNTEEDYYHDTNVSARIDVRPSETVEIGFSARHSESTMDIDGGYPFADDNEVQEMNITSLSTHFDQDILDCWQHIIKLGITDTKREYTNDGAFNGTYNGTTKLASWQHNFFIGEIDTITAGFDHQKETGDIKDPWGDISEKSVDTKSFFIQNKLALSESLSLTLGGRHDDHETFGSENTYKAAMAYLLRKTGTKIRASYGTGFRAPSLYQLYSASGNTDLKPEESKGYDAGIDQKLFGEKVLLSVTWFHNDIDNMIDWQWTGPGMYDGQYFNVNKAQTEGWETGLSITPLTWLTFNVHYTYTEAKNKTEGSATYDKYLIYRPRHTGGAYLNIKPTDKLNVNLNAQYVGKRYRTTDNGEEMSAYTLLNLAASYDINTWLTIFGRVENLTDKNYQSIYEYGEPGIGFYGGIRTTF